MNITAVGDCGVDIYSALLETRPGGISYNFVIHAQSLFPTSDVVTLISAIGDDQNGADIMSALQTTNVRPLLQINNGKTAVQHIFIEPNGEKRFFMYQEGVLKNFRITSEQGLLIEKSDLVITPLFSQIDGLFESSLIWKPRGVRAIDFMDLSDYSKKTAVVQKYLDAFDIGFFGLSADETEIIAALRELARIHSKLIVVTLGKHGSLAFSSGEDFSEPAVPVSEVIDTTGAGDSFAAAFLCSYLYTHDIQKSLNDGARYAAKIITKVGST